MAVLALPVAALCSVHPSPSGLALEQLVHLEYVHDRVSIEQLLFDGVARPRDGALFPDLERPDIELFYEIDGSPGFARGFLIQLVGRSRSDGPSMCSPMVIGARCLIELWGN
jgi:hypothetical protein